MRDLPPPPETPSSIRSRRGARARRGAAACALAAVVLAACGGGAPERAVDLAPPDPTPSRATGVAEAERLAPDRVGGTVTIAWASGEPSTLNWLASTDSTSLALAHLISDSLVFNDADLDIVGKLAESWDWSDDGRTLTFHLRSGARWEDGVPVTSDDVVYTFESLRDPERGAELLRANIEGVTAVEAPDPATVVVRYAEPSGTALVRWNVPLLPAHRYRAEASFHDNPLARRPLSCGPFRFASWTPGQEIVLEANPDYVLGRPGVDRLVFRFIAELSTQLQAIERGEVDYASLNPLTELQARDDPALMERFEVESFYVMFVFYIAWNGDGSVPFLTEPRVRRAFTQALDRQGYLDGPLHGRGLVATGSTHPASWAYDRDVRPWPFDPPAARALLEEAGWTDTDGDGVRDRDGEPMELSLLYWGEQSDPRRMAAWVRDSLRDVGVRVELDPLPTAILYDRLTRREFDAAMLGTRFDVDPDVYELWHSSAIDGGANRAAYANPEVDRLLEAGRRVADLATRREAYRRVQEILHRDQPFTFLFYPASAVAVSRDLRGVRLSPRGPLLFWPGAAGWWRAPAEGGR